MTNNILDLEKFRAGFKFKKAKKRGRPSKRDKDLDESRYPDYLTLTISYNDRDEVAQNYTIHLDRGPFNVKDMTIEHKKFWLEIAMKFTADICYDSDPSLVCELQEWLAECFMKKNIEINNKE